MYCFVSLVFPNHLKNGDFLLYICIDYLFQKRLMPCIIYAAYIYGAYVITQFKNIILYYT